MNDVTMGRKDKLLAELGQVVNDAQALLDVAAGQVDEGTAEARGRLKVRLQQARESLHDLQDSAVARAKEAGQATDTYVRDNPWKAIGIAAGVGLLIGALISRR